MIGELAFSSTVKQLFYVFVYACRITRVTLQLHLVATTLSTLHCEILTLEKRLRMTMLVPRLQRAATCHSNVNVAVYHVVEQLQVSIVSTLHYALDMSIASVEQCRGFKNRSAVHYDEVAQASPLQAMADYGTTLWRGYLSAFILYRVSYAGLYWH